ncbi:MAG: VCBS repeat-containing protein [Planctomycetes bacterium]|nr:VCBS repeat-containing protein [Planctomycetota bacterium]
MRRIVRLNDGKPPFLTHRIVDADGDGDIELLRQPGATGDLALHDPTGRVLWRGSAPRGGFEHASSGDLDGDGRLELLAWGFPYAPRER